VKEQEGEERERKSMGCEWREAQVFIEENSRCRNGVGYTARIDA